MYGMNQNYAASDPSAPVPQQLLPHVHLISAYRFPTLPALHSAQALDYLTKAPTIVKSTAAVAWTYFASPPPDGTVILTWQPPRLGTHYASDGMIWADAEVAYDLSVGNYQLQVLAHKSGYHYPRESVATHARYRYRITAGPGSFDPSLWIVHYAQAEPTMRIPAQQIPIHGEVQAQLAMRAQFQSAGPLIRKEFMLHDSANWPKVEFQTAQRGQQAYYNPMQQRQAIQQPPNKRLRTAPPPRAQAAAALNSDPALEDEEDATRDAFDLLQPRDISLTRYKQHHEWMEEIFSSPHDISTILPVDLGLGLMGELAPLTADILDAPGGEVPTDANGVLNDDYFKKSKLYEKLQPEQLKTFEDRVSAYIAKETAEIEKMKAAHAKKMADVKRSRTYIKAERRLRDHARTAAAAGKDDEADGSLDLAVKDLEKSLGVEFDDKKLVVCVDKGGFIEVQQPPPPKPHVNGNQTTASQANGGSSGLGQDSGLDLDNSAASLLDQFGTGSLTGTPGANLSIPAMSQPQSQSQSAVATPSALATETAQNTAFDEGSASLDAVAAGDDLLDLDVEMAGMTNTEEKAGDDWVMVPDQAANAQQSKADSTQPASTVAPAASSAAAASAVDADAGGMFNTSDFANFDNLDTAGDALAEYTNVEDDNLGLDLVDESAFGDAFHGMEGMEEGNDA